MTSSGDRSCSLPGLRTGGRVVTPGEDRSCSDGPAPGLGLGPLAAAAGQPGHANQRRWDIVEMLFCTVQHFMNTILQAEGR